jgi:ornithine cyclodeaminase
MEHVTELVNAKSILYLSESEVIELGVFDFKHLRAQIEKVYRLHWQNQVKMPKTDYLTYDGRSSYDRIIVLLGSIGGAEALSGIKLICSSTTNRKLGWPRASGLVVLNDVETQRPFCIMQAAQISAARTAAVTAVALSRLLPGQVRKVAFIGCGFLARVHVLMWSQLYGDQHAELHFYDLEREAEEQLADYARSLGLKTVLGTSARQVIEEADVVLPATTATSPYIEAGWIKEGSLYSAVSLLDPELEVFRRSDHVVVDDLETCKNEGRPLQLLDRNGETQGMSILSIGQVIALNKNLRTTGKERILFNPMGTVITDLAVAGAIFAKASGRRVGTPLPV